MGQIRLQRVHDGAVLPSRATAKSFGYDLAICKEETIPGRSAKILPTGWKLAEDLPLVETTTLLSTPNGLEKIVVGGVSMQVLPRSSTILKYGLLVGNSPGLVDADYTGEIGIVAYNLRDEAITLPAGTRLAQLVFGYLDFFDVIEVSDGDQRAERGGFGSTGA